MDLLPHQITDASFLAARNFAGCFNGMGSGKTLTSLEAAKLLNPARILIIAPPIALPMWRDVSAEWLDCPSQILATGKAVIGPEPILVVSYEIATKRSDELAEWAMAAVGNDPTILICDESHALKSTKAKRTKAILGRRGLVESFDYNWLLTGTPVTRWNDDIMPFLMRAAPKLLRKHCGALTIDRFNLQFCIVQEKKFTGMRFPVKMTVGSKNEKLLGEILSTVATRRTLADVWDAMPALTFTRYEVNLSNRTEIASMLKALNKMSLAEIEQAMKSDDEALATVRRQIGMGMVKDAAAFVCERVESGLPVIVGAWHTDVIDALAAELHAYRIAIIDGRTSAARKEEITADWNAGNLDVIVGQIGAMGVSLNLQKGGNNIIVVEEDWSPSIMDQFYARLHRMGQEKAVHVDTLFADTPLNKALTTIAGRKRRSHAVLGNAIEGKDL